MFEIFANPEIWASFATLTILEIVLGIDNIIVLSIVVGRLPQHQQKSARFIGLFLAMFMRVMLLLSISWMSQLKSDLFNFLGYGISGRDLILGLGGLFLIYKATKEIYASIEEASSPKSKNKISYLSAITQIIIMDLVFSLDTVITAVGLSNNLEVMVAAIIVAIAVMMLAAKPIGDFIAKHPSVKMLALAFLLLIGVLLLAEAFDYKIDKKFVYVAMAFSLAVESLNLWYRKKTLAKK